MKHTLRITILLISLFLLAQVIGLIVIKSYEAKKLPYGIEPPKIEPQTSFLQIIGYILIATIVLFLLMRLKWNRVYKIWFLLGVWLCLLLAFSSFLKEGIALGIALILAVWRVYKPNVIVHNFTEIFIYGGLAAMFVPILNIFSISILLILISIYDMIAVWKTKHMIKLAKFQTKQRIFAGFLIPYKKKIAILGGGDVGLPLLFAGTILRTYDIFNALIIVLFSALALFILLIKGKEKRFYPAMPFISIGCFIGLLMVYLLSYVF